MTDENLTDLKTQIKQYFQHEVKMTLTFCHRTYCALHNLYSTP